MSWGKLANCPQPFQFLIFSFLLSTTQPSQNRKKEKENLYPAPYPPQKRKRRDLFPLTTLHKSKKWTCTQSLTLQKNKNKNRLNTHTHTHTPLHQTRKLKEVFAPIFCAKP
jgi:hypothetical protein